MPSWKDHYQGDFLKGDDPRLANAYMSLTIASVEIGTTTKFGSDEEVNQIQLTFHEIPERLGLNKGNCERMEQLTGTDDYQYWRGHQVHLYSENIRVAGNMRQVIRIYVDPMAGRQQAPVRSQPVQQPRHAPDPHQPPHGYTGAATSPAAQNLGQTTRAPAGPPPGAPGAPPPGPGPTQNMHAQAHSHAQQPPGPPPGAPQLPDDDLEAIPF